MQMVAVVIMKTSVIVDVDGTYLLFFVAYYFYLVHRRPLHEVRHPVMVGTCIRVRIIDYVR